MSTGRKEASGGFWYKLVIHNVNPMLSAEHFRKLFEKYESIIDV